MNLEEQKIIDLKKKRCEYSRNFKARQMQTNKEEYLAKLKKYNHTHYLNNMEKHKKICSEYYHKNKILKSKEQKISNPNKVSYYQKNKERILQELKTKYHEKYPNARYNGNKEIPKVKPPEPKKIYKKKIISKTKLKQRKIENHLKKLQIKKQEFISKMNENLEPQY
jgi:hypothetical protein